MKSKDRKIEFRFFTIPEWKKEQAYLAKQHRNGWKFVRVNLLGCYHFEKCKPEEVIYQLDYNPQDRSGRPEYVQLFQDCGWEYIQDFVGYSYFRKSAAAMNGHEEQIFCDDPSRRDMLKRVFRGRMLPLITIFFCIVLPQLWVQHHMGHDTMFRVFAVLGVVYLLLFAWFGYQYWRGDLF